MDSPRTYWLQWTESLRRMGLEGLAVWLLEASGPVHILGAQLLYIGQPFVSPQASDGLRALANLLEQEDETRAFTVFLQRSPDANAVAHEPQSQRLPAGDPTGLKGHS